MSVIACIVKDIEEHTPILFQSIDNAHKTLNSKILIYENNSSDNTRSIISSYVVGKEDYIKFIYEDIDESSVTVARNIYNKPCKDELVCRARNRLLEELESQMYNDMTFIIMFDIMGPNPIPVAAIKTTIDNETFDAAICNGIESDGRIVDLSSLRTETFPFGPEVIGQEFWKNAHKNLVCKSFLTQTSPVPLISGYNGLCILKKNSIHGLRFSCFPTKKLDALYRMRCNEIIHPSTLEINDSSVGMYFFNDRTVFYKNTKGYNMPIINMFVNLFLEMHHNNKTKIFLFPKLIVRYYKTNFIL
jgi:hypothetical protein